MVVFIRWLLLLLSWQQGIWVLSVLNLQVLRLLKSFFRFIRK